MEVFLGRRRLKLSAGKFGVGARIHGNSNKIDAARLVDPDPPREKLTSYRRAFQRPGAGQNEGAPEEARPSAPAPG